MEFVNMNLPASVQAHPIAARKIVELFKSSSFTKFLRMNVNIDKIEYFGLMMMN